LRTGCIMITCIAESRSIMYDTTIRSSRNHDSSANPVSFKLLVADTTVEAGVPLHVRRQDVAEP
jgi:hypothetical protein